MEIIIIMEKINGEKDTKTCIALIDYENYSNLKNISLKEYIESGIFTGLCRKVLHCLLIHFRIM